MQMNARGITYEIEYVHGYYSEGLQTSPDFRRCNRTDINRAHVECGFRMLMPSTESCITPIEHQSHGERSIDVIQMSYKVGA